MLLEVSALTVRIRQGASVLTAVDAVSFSIASGEVVGVVGESGCGKSLTGQSLMRLLREPPVEVSASSIKFAGSELAGLPQAALRPLRGREVGMIFQEPMTSLNPVLRIGDQVGEVLQTHFPELSKKDIRDRVHRMLEAVGIADASGRAASYPHELSGGLRQRAMIAQALVAGPKLLIADEPTTALDVTIQSQILKLLRDLQEERNLSVFLVSHDFGVMAELADRILVMYAGRIVESATWKQIFDSPRHPYTQGLLRCLPGQRKPRERLPGIQGSVPTLGQYPSGCRFHPRCPIATERCRVEVPVLEAVGAEVGQEHRVACFEAHK